MLFIKTFESYKSVDKLSGVSLVVDGKILLVHSEKHKKTSDMWSLPKGHIDGSSRLKSALKELKEETGIKLDKSYSHKKTINYKRGNKRKVMTVYFYYKTKEEIDKWLGTKYKIKKKVLNRVDEEIYDVKFYPINKAKKVLDPSQQQILRHLDKSKIYN